jgi:beta-lactamase regulating signal transducer with metallopeptidase domain
MSWLIESALSNALLATPLAVLAWALGATLRRPALAHALWLLVLVKLVTPPLVSLPVPAPEPLAAWWPAAEFLPADMPVGHAAASAADRSGAAAPPALPTTPVDAIVAGSQSATPAAAPRPAEANVSPTTAPSLIRAGLAFAQRLAWPVLLSAWLLGAVAWYALNVHRLIAFRRAVRRLARRDETLQQRTAELAAKLGLARVPQVRIVPGVVSPMLWGCGPAAQILFPRALLSRLEPEGRDAVLLHELAHFRRGDHWVRLLELLVTGLYWWQPVTWWARRAIAATEEQCCDAWVVDHLAGSPRPYADALLETLDFIAARSSAPLASGMSDVLELEQRLRTIMTGRLQRSLSRAGRWLVAVGAVALPLHPALHVRGPDAALAASSAREPGDLRLPDPSAQAFFPTDAPAETAAGLPAALPPPTDHPLLRTGPVREGWGSSASDSRRFRLVALPAGEARLEDSETGRSYAVAASGITAAQFVSDRQLLVGTRDGAVRLHDAASGEPISFLGRHRAEITALATSRDGRRAVTGAQDGSLFVWDLAAGGAILWDSNVELPIAAARISSDGRTLALAAGDWRSPVGLALLHDLADGTLRQRIELPAPAGALAFRQHDRALWAADWSGAVTVWDTATGWQIDRGRVAKESVSAAALLDNEEALADAVLGPAPAPVAETAALNAGGSELPEWAAPAEL